MFELHVQKGDRELGSFPVGEAGLLIGRNPEADVILSGVSVSRRHARVTPSEGTLLVEDLDSRNGLIVNGRRVPKANIGAGDEFLVGEYSFSVFVSGLDPLRSTASVITYGDGAVLYENMVAGSAGHLPVLYRAAQLLGEVFDLDELLRQTLTLIFDALPAARRGFVLTVAGPGNDATVRAMLARENESDMPPLSKTLVNRILAQGDAVLTRDAQDDSRFDASVSIVMHAIRSAMCVPLCGRAKPVGAIYIDSGSVPGHFSSDDLKLLMAIGRVVGIAVENAQLYQQNMEQERLAAIGLAMANIGHCVKNILSGMLGGVRFMELGRKQRDWDQIESGWPMLHRAINRIELMVLNLLTFSRDRTPERTPTDLNRLIEEVLEIVRPNADRRGVEVVFDPAPLERVSVDGRGIYRVVLNLALNGVDACEGKGGAVTVRCVDAEDGYLIEVSDTGIGIPPERLDSLFQAFNSTKGSAGTGLGLACSEKIAREHGGSITCKSVVGEGSTFAVFLPKSE